MDHPWKTSEVFDVQDYLHFFRGEISEAKNQKDLEVILEVGHFTSGAKILDLACGHGRISTLLAKQGYRVTGVDISADFLQLAEQVARDQGLQISYVQGDVREFKQRGFDAVISWFTSFGYYEDDGNRTILDNAYGALKVGGELILDIPNRDAIMRDFSSLAALEQQDGVLLRRRSFDVATGRAYSNSTVFRDNHRRDFSYYTRLFTFTEIKDWLHQSGFSSVEAFDHDARPLAAFSPRMIIVAKK